MLAAVAANALAGLPAVEVGPREVALESRFDGVVEAVKKATVQAQTSGQIREILFDVDDFVERGAVLIRLEDKTQQARFRQAEAARQEAQARLREAENEFRRVKGVFEKKLVSKADMDRASAALKAARARLARAEAALAGAREQLEYTVIRAPYSGIVVERHVEVGEMATPGKPLMTGVSLEHLRVLVHIPQRYVDEVRAGVPVRVYPDEGGPLEAARVTVYPYADPASHNFRVRVRLPQGVKGLYPGMLVKVGFALGQRERLVVPAKALVQRSEVTGLYVMGEGDRLSFRQVRTGERLADGSVVVLAGLAAGERVVLDPVAATVALKRQQEAGE